VQLIFGTQPARQNITKTCALESIGLCECPNGKQLCKLLPDLVIVPYFTKTQIQEYAYNDNQYPHQLKLAAAIANIGYGPMEIKGSNEWICGKNKTDSGSICPNGMVSRMKVKQRIFTKNNDSLLFEDCDAGTMYFEDKPGHNHFHVNDWVAFRLIKKINKKRTVVAKGNKVSYCLFTNGIFYQNDSIGNINNKQYGEKMPNYGIGYYPTCDFNKQGISVGGYDFYGMLYEGQYLTLPKGIKNGTYILEIEIDPNHWYQESNKKNNVFSMQITLTKQEH
jgi:hypothetical protein